MDDGCDDINKDGDSVGGDWDEIGFANCHFGQLSWQSVVADNIFANCCSSHLFLQIELMDNFLATCCSGQSFGNVVNDHCRQTLHFRQLLQIAAAD